MRYSIQLRDQTIVKGCGNMGKSFGKNISKNLSSKYSSGMLAALQTLLDHFK